MAWALAVQGCAPEVSLELVILRGRRGTSAWVKGLGCVAPGTRPGGPHPP